MQSERASKREREREFATRSGAAGGVCVVSCRQQSVLWVLSRVSCCHMLTPVARACARACVCRRTTCRSRPSWSTCSASPSSHSAPALFFSFVRAPAVQRRNKSRGCAHALLSLSLALCREPPAPQKVACTQTAAFPHTLARARSLSAQLPTVRVRVSTCRSRSSEPRQQQLRRRCVRVSFWGTALCARARDST
eukprot:854121-Rhodomonas_salina.1